jgi:hypothetical protein
MLHPYQVVQYIHPQQRVDFDIFLFINTKSGGQVGMKFMTLEVSAYRKPDGDYHLHNARAQDQRELL